MRPVIIQLITVLFSFLLLTNCTKENTLTDIHIPVDIASSSVQAGKGENLDKAAVVDFQSYVQEEMQAQHIPALSVLIFEEEEILYEGCFGKSSLEKNTALQNDHLFLLASISKVVTATALLQLYDQGHFSLDDPINDYLNFEVAIPGYVKDITFRMLLTHTSGIADGSALDDQYYYGEDSPVELADFLEDYLTPNGAFYDKKDNFHNFEPSSQQEYSNIGAALIGLLVEEISKMDFDDYCKQHIFQPLDMTNTAWHLEDIHQSIVQPYDYIDGRYEKIEHYTFTDYPNGGLRSTAGDLFKFLSAFVQDGESNNYQLLNPSTIQAMTALQIPTLSEDMGLHLFQMDKTANLWGHDGGEQGVATMMAFNPIDKVGVIILTNQGEADLDDLLLDAYELGTGL